MEKNLPPGLLPHSEEDGNLPDISSAGSIYHFLMDLHKQFGPIASFWWGKTYTVSIASPELFEEQLDLTERPPQPYEFFNPFVFEQKSIQFANLEDGINRIQHYSKALSEDAVKRYIPQFQEVADEIASKWSKTLKESSIPLARDMSVYSAKAVLHSLFGNLMKNESEELDFRAEANEVWAEIEDSLTKPRSEKQMEHLEEDKKDLHRLVEQMIKERKANPGKVGEENLLDCIISYSDDEEIQFADALQFSAAGQMTLEYFLTSAFYFIVTNPNVEKKLLDEIHSVLGDTAVTGSNIGDLVYLRQVLDEALRCSVTCGFGSRFQYTNSKLGGFDIPKNTPVIHAINVAMKNEAIWSDPDRFDPDRFNKENCKKRSSLWFCPYGVGKRDCLVRHYPYPAAAVVVVTLLRKFKIHLVNEQQKLSIAHGLVPHLTEEIFIRLEARKN